MFPIGDIYQQSIIDQNTGQILATQQSLTTVETNLTNQINANYIDLNNKVNNIVSSNIVDLTIQGVDIMDNTLDYQKLVDNINLDSKLLINSLNANKITDNTIDYPKLIDNINLNTKLLLNSIHANKLQDNTIDYQKLIDNINLDSKILINSLNANKLLDNTITTQKFIDNINLDTKLLLQSISFDKLQNNFDLSKFSNSLSLDMILNTNNLGVHQYTKLQDRMIDDNTITSLKLTDNTLDFPKLVDNINVNTKLALNSVNADKLVNASITSAKIGNNQVQTANIANSAVTGQKIENVTIDGGTKIIDNTIDPIKIHLPQGGNPTSRLGYIIGNNANTQVDWMYINQNMIDNMTGKIKASNLNTTANPTTNQVLSYNGTQLYWKTDNNDLGGLVSTANQVLNTSATNVRQFSKLRQDLFDANSISGNVILTDGSVGLSKIAPNSINDIRIVDNAVTTTKIQDQNVTQPKLALDMNINPNVLDNSLNAVKLLDQSITFGKIANNAIQNYHIADGQVYQSKIQNGSINDVKLADNAVSTLKIGDFQVTQTKLGLAMDLNSNIAVNSLQADRIVDNTITEPKLLIQNNPTANQYLSWDVLGMKWADIPTFTIDDNSITEPKLQIFNNPANNQYLQWNTTNGLEWKDISIPESQIPLLTQADSAYKLPLYQGWSLAFNKPIVEWSQLNNNSFIGDSSIIKPKNLISSNQGTIPQFMVPYSNSSGDFFTFDYVNNLINDNSITESKLAIQNTPSMGKVLGYYDDTVTQYLYWVDPSIGSGVPDNYFADSNVVNAKFANDSILSTKISINNRNNSQSQLLRINPSNPNQLQCHQLMSQFSQIQQYGYVPIMSSDNQTLTGSQNLEFCSTNGTSFPFGIYQPAGIYFNGVSSSGYTKSCINSRNNGENLGFAFSTSQYGVDAMYCYGSMDQPSINGTTYAKSGILYFFDEDDLNSVQGGTFDAMPGHTVISSTGYNVVSNNYVKLDMREKCCENKDYYNQLLDIKLYTYKLKSYTEIFNSKEFDTFPQKKKDRIQRKKEETHLSISINQMKEKNIFTSCYMDKTTTKPIEQQYQENEINGSTSFKIHEYMMYLTLAIQNQHKTVIQPLQDDVQALKISYQKPEERKELIQKITNIAQTEALDIINQQQIIPMSSIRPSLSPGLLYQNSDGIIGTLSSVDILAIDQLPTLLGDQEQTIQKQQQQIDLLTSTINNLVNTINNLKQSIQTLQSNQQSIQMRLSSNNL